MLSHVFYADCVNFDNHRTGYYATAAEAEKAFWMENRFSAGEREEVQLYTREVKVTDELLEDAKWLLKQGSPSPALGLTL